MKATPVTVVINTLNRSERLERTLIALRQLTYPTFEVVVVNGPSTDGTAEMLEQFVDRARVVTCVEANLGLSRNTGVQHAAGDIVVFIDDDAIPPADWIEFLVVPFADENVGAVGGPVFDVPRARIDWEICTCSRLGVPNTRSPAPIGCYRGVGSDPFAYLAGCNMSFRRSVLRELGGFDSNLSYGYDDVDICRRLNDAGYRIEYVESAIVRHDRAANAMRDERQTIKDPYSLIRSRAIFALRCEHSKYSPDEIAHSIHEWETEWRSYSSTHLESGHFTVQEHEYFVDRVRSGAIDGLAVQHPRELVTIDAPPIGVFRQYR